MKHTLRWLAWAAALTWTAGICAADAPKTVMRDYTDTVAPADQQAYEAGIKSYNQCLGQHGFKYAWNAWNHETGDTYTYSYVTEPMPWANHDAMRAAAKECDASARTNINPHLKSEVSAFLEVQPDMSHVAKGASNTPPYIEVVYFKLKYGHDNREAFTGVVKKIAAAAEKSKWPYNFTFGSVRGGGDGSPDYIVVLPSKTWAEVGGEANPTLWAMVENVYGKDEAQAMRKTLNDSVQDQNSHIDSYNADLSYKPSSK